MSAASPVRANWRQGWQHRWEDVCGRGRCEVSLMGGSGGKSGRDEMRYPVERRRHGWEERGVVMGRDRGQVLRSPQARGRQGTSCFLRSPSNEPADIAGSSPSLAHG
nr:hypothetical protein CFP56_12261 [Quercus suber]